MKLLFYVSKLYSLPVVQPVISEALKRGAEVALYVSSKVKRKLPGHISSLNILTNLEEAISFKSDFVLCPGNFVDFRIPGIKVELFHGIAIEKPSHYKIRHFFDLYLTSGPAVTERYIDIQQKHRYFAIAETGWPKIDHILSYDSIRIRERFDIPKEKNVVLYAPTHSRRMESAEEIIPAIDRVMLPDEIWICKPHEFMAKTLLNELRGKKIILVDDYDITPYLHLADVLVSDTSSVIYEFMVLNKPVVTYKTLSRKDKGIDIQSPGELRGAIDRSLSNPDEFSKNRLRHLAEVNPRLDGSVSARILDLIMTTDPALLVGKGRKPMNLFRKIQLLYHSRFKTGYLR